MRAVELLASELVTNAVRYGPAEGWVYVHTGTDSDPDLILLAVTDGGESLPRMREPDRDGGGGFGLHLVERLTHTWGVDTSDGATGKTVWARIPLDGPPGTPFSRSGGNHG